MKDCALKPEFKKECAISRLCSLKYGSLPSKTVFPYTIPYIL